MEIDIDEFTRDIPYELRSDMKYIKTIDHGAFGTVLHVLDLSSNQEIAVKVINKNETTYSYIEKIKEEISILKILNHPNIVKFYGYIETSNQLLIKMEYIKYGSLKQWIKGREKISEEEASIIISKILSAIEYLHSKQICHRDIKPENIMLSRENDLTSIKVIDFGLSAQNFDRLINSDYCGTYIYMAPELIEKKLYFLSVDIWSIGVLMYILLNKGKHPFYAKGDKRYDVAKKLKLGKIYFYEKISPYAEHLIHKLLESNPSWRYTASQAIKHPWITRNLNDVPPSTFNELLVKSNNKKIMKDLFNTCLFLNYFSKKRKHKFFINKNYIQKCFYFSELNKNTINKQKEKGLDIIGFDENEKNNSMSLENKDKSRNNNRGNPYSVFTTNIEKTININIIQNERKKFKKIKSNGKIINLLKKYQNNKTSSNNLGVQRLKSTLINAPKMFLRKNISHRNKSELTRNSYCNSMRGLSNLTSKKNHSISICNKINEELKTEKVNEERKIKSKKDVNNFEKTKRYFHYFSSKKIVSKFPKLENAKKINLFQRNSHMSLNNVETFNIAPLILPNLGKPKKNKEKSTKAKSFIKMRTLK